MLTVMELLRKDALENVGIRDWRPTASLEDLRSSEWCPEFEQLMRNRLIMGAIRYGCLGAFGKPEWDRVEALVEKAKEYARTGNKESLVDIANYALLEFVEGKHPSAYFGARDDSGVHCRMKGEE